MADGGKRLEFEGRGALGRDNFSLSSMLDDLGFAASQCFQAQGFRIHALLGFHAQLGDFRPHAGQLRLHFVTLLFRRFAGPGAFCDFLGNFLGAGSKRWSCADEKLDQGHQYDGENDPSEDPARRSIFRAWGLLLSKRWRANRNKTTGNKPMKRQSMGESTRRSEITSGLQRWMESAVPK